MHTTPFVVSTIKANSRSASQIGIILVGGTCQNLNKVNVIAISYANLNAFLFNIVTLIASQLRQFSRELLANTCILKFK